MSTINYEGYPEYDGKTVYKAEAIENEIKKELDLKIFDTMDEADNYTSKSLNDVMESFEVKAEAIITGGSYQRMGWAVNDVSALIELLGLE